MLIAVLWEGRLVAVFGTDGVCPFYAYRSYLFCYHAGSIAVPLSGSLGQVSGNRVSDCRDFSAGAGSGNLLDGILSGDGPSGRGGRQWIRGNQGGVCHCAGNRAGV